LLMRLSGALTIATRLVRLRLLDLVSAYPLMS
jgi:hypothetical protein